MPVDRDAVLSPPPREYSASPPPFAGADRTDRTDQPGPSKKSKVTANDLQRRQLDKLLNNPDKEIRLPTATKERTLRAPVEMMKSVQGSSSGAGSGEFHVYKQSRRREYERMKLMEDKARALEEQNAFKARQEARDAITDAKTAKNRLKRLKRKSGRKGPGPADAAGGGGPGAGAGAGGASGGGLKRKLEGGAGTVVFRKPGEESEEDGEEEDGEGGEEPGPKAEDVMPSVHEMQARAAAVEEARILVHDDE